MKTKGTKTINKQQQRALLKTMQKNAKRKNSAIAKKCRCSLLSGRNAEGEAKVDAGAGANILETQ